MERDKLEQLIIDAEHADVQTRLTKAVATLAEDLDAFKEADTHNPGPKGDKGDKGDVGAQGERGPSGPVGPQGAQGAQGVAGLDGRDGLNGLNGRDGQDGLAGKDGSPDTPEQVITKVNTASTLIKKTRIEGLDDIERIARANAFNPTIGPSFSDLAAINTRIDNLPASTGGGSGTPGGSDTQIQFNDGGSFGGDSKLTFDKTGTGLVTIGSIDAVGSNGLVLAGGKYLQFNDDDANKQVQIGIQAAQTTDAGGTTLIVYAGDGNGNGKGGNLNFTAGFGGSGSANGGDLRFQGGPSGQTDGIGGGMLLAAGNGIAGNASGGATRIAGGDAYNPGSGNGGDVHINSGVGGSLGGSGGSVFIEAEQGLGGGLGGNIIIIPGSGGLGGHVYLYSNTSANYAAILDTSLMDVSDKTFTFPNKDGTFAMLDDIAGASFVDNEIVSGSGTAYTLANTPVAGSVHLYAGGIRLTPGVSGDYTISGTGITTVNSYSTGDLLADYRI